jgi:hypothetical protein
MNRVVTTILMIVLMLLSCGKETERIVDIRNECPPSPPRGIIATNHVSYVTICWNSNINERVTGYLVYYGYWNQFDEIEFDEENPIADILAPASEPEWYCVDDLETQNAEQWLYGVRAYNQYGLSEWSYIEQGTPRPEGRTRLFEHVAFPLYSGFDFTFPDTVGQAWDAAGTDIYFSIETGISEIRVNPEREVGIQDYGYVEDWEIFEAFDLISYAPADGWSPSGRVEAITGHMYMLRLDRDEGLDLYHYAKIFVTEVGPDYVRFRWAYQEDIGNPDLAPPPPSSVGGDEMAGIGGVYPEDRSDRDRGFDKGSTIPPIVQREGNMDMRDEL